MATHFDHTCRRRARNQDVEEALHLLTLVNLVLDLGRRKEMKGQSLRQLMEVCGTQHSGRHNI